MFIPMINIIIIKFYYLQIPEYEILIYIYIRHLLSRLRAKVNTARVMM